AQFSAESRARKRRSASSPSRGWTSVPIIATAPTFSSSWLFAAGNERRDTGAQFQQRHQFWPGHRGDLVVPTVDRLGELQHLPQPLQRDRMDRRIAFSLGDAGAQRLERGIDLLGLAPGRDAGSDFPDIDLGLEMVAAVAPDRDPADQVPGQQLLEG